MAADLYCPRCEVWTVKKAPPGDRCEAYCTRAGCEWEGKLADSRSTLDRLGEANDRIAELEATLRDIRADVRSRFVSPQWDIKHVGTVSHCGICGANGEEDGEPNHTPSCTLSIGVT